MKRKLILSLGAISALTPVVAVVACGKINEPTAEQLDLFRKLSSAETQRILEEKWDEMVLKDPSVNVNIFPTADDANIVKETVDGKEVVRVDRNGLYTATSRYKLDVTKSPELKEVAYYILRNEIAKDKQYLFKISAQLLGDRVKMWQPIAGDATTSGANWDLSTGVQVTREYLVKIGLSSFYEYGNLPVNAVTDDALNILLNYSKLDFRVKVYRQLVAESFLKTNKDLYSKAFIRNARNFSLTQQAIAADEFTLVNEALSQKLFAQWNITLDKDESKGFLNKEVATLADVRNQFTKGTGPEHDLYNAAKKSLSKIVEHEKTIAGNFIINDSYAGLIGWKGFNNQSAVGTKALSFSLDELKKITTKAGWEGVVQKDDLATTKIVFVDSENQKQEVNMTYQIGILPIYVDGKLTLAGNTATPNFDAASIAQVRRLLAYKNTGLYKTASEFFRTKFDNHEAITLKIANDDVKKILEDANFEFIKERTAE